VNEAGRPGASKISGLPSSMFRPFLQHFRIGLGLIKQTLQQINHNCQQIIQLLSNAQTVSDSPNSIAIIY
jgi:hypothetical protein